MRCQKACSYLPAYCNNELSGEKQVEVSEHLASCQDCRNQETAFLAIRTGAPNLSSRTVSRDFNVNLLNRIAEERYAETRSAAYLPRTAPRLFQRGLVPALSSLAVAAVAVVITMSSSKTISNSGQFASTDNLDNSYLTVQPVNNPNMSGTAQLPRDWSLNTHMARSERYNRLSTSVAPTWASFATSSVPVYSPHRIPYNMTSYQARPIIRQYITTSNGTIISVEGTSTY